MQPGIFGSPAVLHQLRGPGFQNSQSNVHTTSTSVLDSICSGGALVNCEVREHNLTHQIHQIQALVFQCLSQVQH